MRRALAEHGLEADNASFWEPFRHYFARSNTVYWLERFERKLHILDVLEFSFRDSFAGMGLGGYRPRELAATYWRHFCSLFVPEEGAEGTIAALYGTYKLAIVSNGIGEAQRSRLAAGQIGRFFEALAVSDEAGVAKPDPRIFHAALERLGLGPDEVLFVGDSLQDDYAGAVRAGIDFCYYNRRRAPLEPDIRPAYIIERLRDLPALLS
jgi:HAD superfamily hydrolase (TIGR01549 family)